MNIIDEIRNEFIKESKNSPVLLADLANMENYISESYTGRSLIELLQNADDVGASSFYVEVLDDSQLIVANNGRPFTKENFISLCRSGASTKKRKGDTIGFRGIGFKSVINYANEVYLFSGEYEIRFSKFLTSQALGIDTKVPLIRIPHRVESSFSNRRIDSLKKEFNTIFLFNTKNTSFITELEEFNSSCMLFLRNIKKVTIVGRNACEYILEREHISNSICSVKLENNSKLEVDKWLILKSVTKKYSAVAFKLNDGIAIPATADESVVHSFMPTKERLSIPAKINGDFSTDPSRTKVIYDEDTFTAIDDCVKIIIDYIKQLSFKKDNWHILNILSNANVDPLCNIKGKTINDLFVERLKNKIKDIFNDNVYLKPFYITSSDYRVISERLNYQLIDNDELMTFLSKMSIPTCSLTNCVLAMADIICSEITRIDTISEIVKTTRFGSDQDLFNAIENAKLFSSKGNVVPISHIRSAKEIEEEFFNSIISRIGSFNDLDNFLKKFNIKSVEHKESSALLDKIEHQRLDYSKTIVVPKWRSVEQNVASVLESLANVNCVKDVSAQNLGYDLEVILTNGEHQFVEVKSVEVLGESISITNNEYSTANQHQNNFILAIACQDNNGIEVCLINNPINTLSLTKRVVRWEWVCSQYSGKVIKKKFRD